MRSWLVRRRSKTGKVYLYQRYWDGIDKPEYMPILELRENEYLITDGNDIDGVQLKSDRLNLLNSIKNGSFPMVIFQVQQSEIQDLFDFIGEHIKDTWGLSFEGSKGDGFWNFELSTEDRDFLMHFRLAWPNHIDYMIGID